MENGAAKGIWKSGWNDKILDMDTSNKKVMAIAEKVFTSDKATPAEQNMMASLLSQRQQKISLFSNMMRMIYEGASQVIRNIRA
jgi:hypothetical protein